MKKPLKKKEGKKVKGWVVTTGRGDIFHPQMFDRAYSTFRTKKDATNWMKVNVHPGHSPKIMPCTIAYEIAPTRK